MEFGSFILVFIIAFILGGKYGWGLRERMAERHLTQLLKHVEIEEEQEELKMPISVEKHNDILFVYNKTTNEFLAQGKTATELSDALEKRFPGKRFECTPEHLEILNSAR